MDVSGTHTNNENIQSCVLYFLVCDPHTSYVPRFSIPSGEIQLLGSTGNFPRSDNSSLSLVRDDTSIFRYSPPLKIVRKILSKLLIIALGFLPFMPVMHAEGSHTVPDSHHMEASGCCHDCQKDPEHNMQVCIDVVHDILWYSSINFPHTPEVIVAIFPYWNEKNPREENIYEARYVHSLDPPQRFTENYIGIVKLTV